MGSAERLAPPERTLLPPLLGLTAVTGVVDAVSYLGLGHVFTANMTGNVVFLGFALAGAPGLSIARSSTALVAFIVGAVFGGRASRLGTAPRYRLTTIAFGAEAILLLAAAAVSFGEPATQPEHSARLYAVIVLTAVAMGVRNATVRGLGVSDMTTTVLTLTIAGLAADSKLAGGSNPRWPRRAASVLAMAAGAALGVLLLKHSLALPLAGCALVATACAVAAHFHERERRRPS